ncbi:nucleotide disphospho-sugar-binding domain-containing protein [Streptomyces sp. ICBB 8177]|uniref:nucleotide disphospho-sugar-binding domain-containing protein n=1 Tax=Streptomyces sp. ICBB 8177 TaxID=563922 RepID=UPI000D6724EF|nr:nucleotide disphospho-sugar-binding domain-containing protein [Streptomyces sp. ICBB 8177]PWI45360.1 protein IroB [Streptomyces sp. ICBB 8177]
MRVLFTTWAEPAHLYSLIPLAWAARTAGHEVRIAAPPSIVPAVSRAGLVGVAVGHDVAVQQIKQRADLAPWREPGRWPRHWAAHPENLDDGQRAVLAALGDKQVTVAEAMSDDLVAFARFWRPDVVVHDNLTFAGPVAAAATGVPALGHTWGSATVMRVELTGLRGAPLESYTRLFERFGADPQAGPVGWLDPSPPSMRLPDPLPTKRFAMRYTPFNGPGLVPGWVHERGRSARVCVTSGISSTKVRPGELPEMVGRTLRALVARDVEVVLAVGPGQAGNLGGLPSGVRVAESVPMNALLPTCAAVVHHGGSGTGLTAAAVGTPQLVLPRIPVTAEIGERVADFGAGLIPDFADQDDPEVIGACVDRLVTEPAFAEAAAALRAEIAAQPSPAATVGLLERIALGGPEAVRVAA